MAVPAHDPRPQSPRDLLASLARLEDDGGAESPREQLRAFLVERVTTPDTLRICLDACRASFAEPQRRALQDVVLAAGRLFGFDLTFGSYARPDATAPRRAGEWRWRGRLQVRVLIWTDPLADDAAVVRRQVTEGWTADAQTPSLVLCVTTPTFGATARLEATLAAPGPDLPVATRVISLDALVVLATLVHRGVLRRDEALRELHPPVTLDERIALLARLVETGGTAGTEEVTRRLGMAPLPASCWVYVLRDESATLDVTSTGAGVGALPIQRAAALQVRAGDVVCILRHGTGLTARAEVTGVAEGDGAADGFHVTLRRIRPIDPPRGIGVDQRFDLEMQAAVSKGPLVWVTRGVFDALLSD